MMDNESSQRTAYETRDVPMRNKFGSVGNQLFDDNPLTLWSLGIAGGDIYSAILSEVQDTVAKAGGRRFDAMKAAIERLERENLINEQERKHMSDICDIVFAVIRGKQSTIEARQQVSAIYHKMLVESTEGSIALVFASIAANENGPLKVTVPQVPEGTLAAPLSDDEVTGLILGGMLAGTLAGGKIGSFAGAGGALVGGLLGSIIGGAIGAMTAGCIEDAE